ncbi:MAG: hypothetical protein AB1465_05690 [Patescibacteria group bacterium]
MEKDNEIKEFFENLGEIWRDITAIEFLMRCAIAKKDGDLDKRPEPPYTKDKIYETYPKSFSHFSFEIVTEKFNKRYSHLAISPELVHLRDAMAHGIIAEINSDGIDRLVKFKEAKEGLKVEFSMSLEQERLAQIRQSLKEIRRSIMKEVDDKKV